MVEVRFTRHTTISADRVLAAATDFSDRRPALWPNLDASRYRLVSLAGSGAEAIEGSAILGGIWARERYDWSRHGVVRAEVVDSNVFAAGSSWELHVEPVDDGSTVEWVSIRFSRGLRGRLLVILLALAGRRMLGDALEETFRRLEDDTAESGAVRRAPDPTTG
ncbi:SRPBCC family protein [Agromyces sp. ZXT2-6]|uniref:SRPBCC family protein n=1 Tax=Agromyces sp. ZXT2-6 TaxID=3461153 RepID=UPI004054C85E